MLLLWLMLVERKSTITVSFCQLFHGTADKWSPLKINGRINDVWMTSTPTCLLGKEKSINNRHLQLTEERIKEKYIPHAGYLPSHNRSCGTTFPRNCYLGMYSSSGLGLFIKVGQGDSVCALVYVRPVLVETISHATFINTSDTREEKNVLVINWSYSIYVLLTSLFTP